MTVHAFHHDGDEELIVPMEQLDDFDFEFEEEDDDFGFFFEFEPEE